MDGAHVGVVQGRRRPRLGQEGRRGYRAAGAEDFQGDLPVQVEVAGAEHGAERPSAQLRLDLVRAEHAVGPQLPAEIQRRFPTLPLPRAQPAHLQPFEHAEDLFRISAHCQAVNHLVLEDPVGVDEEQPAQGDVLPFEIDAVGPAGGAVLVGGQGEVQPSQATLVRGSVDPPFMGRYRIGAHPQHVTTPLAELRDPTADRGQLGRSDEGEVARVEEQQEPAVQVVVQRDLPPPGAKSFGAKEGEVRGSGANHRAAHRHRSEC